MRKALKEIKDKRETFVGIFERLGKKPAFRGPDLVTVLLRDIKNSNGQIVADHLWLNYTKGFQAIAPLSVFLSN